METWVLEWSYKTNNYHIQELFRHAAGNEVRFIDNHAPNDYHIIFYGTKDECHDFADKCRFLINQRAKRNE